MRILVADDHTLVRNGLCLLLESIPDVTVVGEASDGREAIQAVARLRPDIVLMDLAMPGVNGLDAIRRITIEFPETRAIALSMHADEAHVQQALAAGAVGYVLKGSGLTELATALKSVHSGVPYLTPAISQSILGALSDKAGKAPALSSTSSLTARQQEVLKLLAEGNSTKQIAHRLALSAKTVEAHRGAIMKRLDIHDIPGLVRYAIKTGLIEGA